MTWLAWRQFRTAAATLLAAAAALVLLMVATRPGLMSVYRLEPRTFLDRLQFDRGDQRVYLVGIAALYLLPPIVGAFWGAPLIARELEAGTHRLAWTQGVTRTRWLAVKLGTTGAATVAAVVPLALVVSWWASPIDAAVDAGRAAGPFNQPRVSPGLFAARGVAPVAYALLALAIGVAVGLVVRRSAAAIGLTLALVVAVELVMPLVVRSHLAAPVQRDLVLSPSNVDGLRGSGDDREHVTLRTYLVKDEPGSWPLDNATVDGTGRVPASLPESANCLLGPPVDASPTAPARPDEAQQQACFDRLAAQGYRQRVSYFPASSFWTLQWREAGALGGLATVLVSCCFWRIRRDLV